MFMFPGCMVPGTFAIYPDTMHPSEMKNNRIVGIFGIVVMMCYNSIIKMFYIQTWKQQQPMDKFM